MGAGYATAARLHGWLREVKYAPSSGGGPLCGGNDAMVQNTHTSSTTYTRSVAPTTSSPATAQPPPHRRHAPEGAPDQRLLSGTPPSPVSPAALCDACLVLHLRPDCALSQGRALRGHPGRVGRAAAAHLRGGARGVDASAQTLGDPAQQRRTRAVATALVASAAQLT